MPHPDDRSGDFPQSQSDKDRDAAWLERKLKENPEPDVQFIAGAPPPPKCPTCGIAPRGRVSQCSEQPCPMLNAPLPELGRNAEAIAKIDKAHQHVADLAAGREKWTMRVPARPDLDSDLIIADALATAKRLLEATVVPSASGVCSQEEWNLLTAAVNQARETLLVSIKGTPEELQSSLGKLNLACMAHWNWRGQQFASETVSATGERG